MSKQGGIMPEPFNDRELKEWRMIVDDFDIPGKYEKTEKINAEIRRFLDTIDALRSRLERMGEDSKRIEFLESENKKNRYTGKCVFRLSTTGRGWRLHETSGDDATYSVRNAIDIARQVEGEEQPKGEE